MPGASIADQVSRGFESVVEAHPIEVLELLQSSLALPEGGGQLRIAQDDVVRAVVEQQVQDLATQVLLQFTVLAFAIAPPRAAAVINRMNT